MIPWQITGPAAQPIFAMEPHGGGPQPNALARRGEVIEIPQGARIVHTGPAKPTGRYEFEFVTEGFDELEFIETFFNAQKGRAGGFWFPTWQWEFDFVSYEMPNFNSYYAGVRHTDYAASVYPLGSHFRQLLLLHGDAWHVHTIDAAVANVSPGIDSLHLTGPLGANSTPDVPLLTYDATRQHDAYRPLWLKWGRFDQDALRVVTKNSALGYFSIAIAFAECPAEVPL